MTTLLDYWDMLRRRAQEQTWRAEERWPERLKLAHDRLVREQKAEENRALSAQIAARADKLDAWEYHFGGLFITPPRSALDLIDEGAALHHCVECYSQRHADGGTTILFIRRECEPDKPFFTLEWSEKEQKVIQNRGNRNCERTPEVREFENAWVDWMRRGRPKKKEAKTA